MLGNELSVFLLARHFLLSFADFGLLWSAQIHCAAWVRVLLDLVRVVRLLDILVGVTLLNSFAAVVA